MRRSAGRDLQVDVFIDALNPGHVLLVGKVTSVSTLLTEASSRRLFEHSYSTVTDINIPQSN